MDIQGKYNNADTSIVVNKNGNLLVNSLAAKYQEACLLGNVFSTANQAGVTTQAGLSATTPALTLYNPISSGVNAVLIYAGCVNIVAFGAGAAIWIGANTITPATRVTGTAATSRSLYLGNNKTSVIQPLLAATLPDAPVAIATIGAGLTGAITTSPISPVQGRYFDGSIIIQPGSAISFQTSTQSGASGFLGEFVWFETSI